MRNLIFLLVAVFLFGVNCFAQNESKFEELRKSIAKSDEAIQNPKKASNVKTWMDRGRLYYDAYDVNVGLLHFGTKTNEAKIFFKDPKQILTSEQGGVLKETYEYSQIKLNFENGTLKTWEETETVTDKPLEKAVSAYQKAATLDEKGKNKVKIDEAYKLIYGKLELKTFNEYFKGNYKQAYQTAVERVNVGKLLNINDTAFYYYAGYFAYEQSKIDSSMWQQAIDNFEKAIALGFKETNENKGQIYLILNQVYMSTGQKEKAIQCAKDGFEKNPENINFIYILINYYLERGERQEALTYIEEAMSKGPPSAGLLFARGTLYNELGQTDKALAAYDEAIAADPKRPDFYYNKAVIYYNKAITLMDEANSAKTNKEFEAKRDLAEAEFMKAIPLLEKSYELKPQERATMDTLKTLYYRLKAKHPEMEAKYNDIVQKLAL